MNRSELEQSVINWGVSKNLNDPIKQTLKTLSEAGELADAICKADKYELAEGYVSNDIVDAIGDIEVCLTILKNQLNLSQSMPLNMAYDVIKNRTGKTINGTFVKDKK